MTRLLLLIFIINFSIHAQDNENEISVDDQRNDAINALIEQIKLNKGIYINQDRERLEKFITRVEERTTLLNDAKAKLNNEKNRNKRLESAFENNEKILADLEEKLQIKIGVLGELFGVARQYAGELIETETKSK